jgi:hypothetical protein
MKLARTWTLYTQARTVDYASGTSAILELATARQLWEMWDHGLAAVVRHVLSSTTKVHAGGGELFAVCLFADDTPPVREDPRCKNITVLQCPLTLGALSQLLAWILYAAVADTESSSQIRGIRCTSNSKGARVELWCDPNVCSQTLAREVTEICEKIGCGPVALTVRP